MSNPSQPSSDKGPNWPPDSFIGDSMGHRIVWDPGDPSPIREYYDLETGKVLERVYQ